MSSMRAVLNGEKKNIHLPHWAGSMSRIRSLSINQIHEKDCTLTIELESLRGVSIADCLRVPSYSVVFESVISLILTCE